MNKEEIKKALISVIEKNMQSMEERIATAHSMVDVDEADVLDPEDLSHQAESSESEQLYRLQLQKAKTDLITVERIDFNAKTNVEPGAFIVTNDFNFIVACATAPFDVAGRHITGISTESTVYKEMKGLKAGDRFTVSGKEHIILEIH